MDAPSPGSPRRPRALRRSSAVLFGAELRTRRTAKGVSQAALAGAAGLSTDAVSKLERGLRQPALETMLRLGAELGVPAAEMVAVVERAWEREP